MKDRQSASRRARGFSLVELLVVVGILALLMAILVPALGLARIRAKEASSKATISALDSAIGEFRADAKIGGAYPPSHVPDPGSDIADPISGSDLSPEQIPGATLLVWALFGADLQGSPGFKDLNQSGTWQDDTHRGPGGLYAMNGATPVRPRVMSSIDSKGILTEFSGGSYVIPAKRGGDPVAGAMFLDTFDQPIIYMRARKGAPAMATASPGDPSGVFNLSDNALIIGQDGSGGMNFGSGATHPLSVLGDMSDTDLSGDNPDTFAYRTMDTKIPTMPRPHRADSYMLISAGADKRFGTDDDLANFEINE